jgi:hypothetical protein
MTEDNSNMIKNNILALVSKREYPKTCCPSEVARALTGEELQQLGVQSWRDAMDIIRDEAYALHRQGKLEVTQKGEKVDLDKIEDVKGPIRLRAMGS